MRKIETKEKIERRSLITKLIVGVILIGLLVISTAGYAFFNQDGSSSQRVKYNGLNFNLMENGYWEFNIQDQVFDVSYNPLETESINADFDLSLNEIYNKPLFFVSVNPSASQEVIQNLGRYVLRYQEVCFEGIPCEDNTLPVKDCSENIIIFKESNLENTSITRDNNCVVIDASYNDQIIAADRLVFKVLEIQN